MRKHLGLPAQLPKSGGPGSREYQLSSNWEDGIARLPQHFDELSFSLDPEQRLGRCQHTTEPQSCRAPGKAGRIIDVDREARDGRWPRGRLESAAGYLGEEAVERLTRVHPQHRFVVAAHADVAHKGRAAR